MSDNVEIKYFLSSDNQFLIDIDKISLITFTGYSGEIICDMNGEPYTYVVSPKETCDIYKSSKDILSSYYNVYIDGVNSPVQLKYTDGVMLMNLLHSQKNVFYNSSYTGNSEYVTVTKLGSINYTLEKYIVPSRLESTLTSIENVDGSTRISIKN